MPVNTLSYPGSTGLTRRQCLLAAAGLAGCTAPSLAFSTSGTGEPLRVSKGIKADIPSRPFGGADDYTISPDGQTLYFAARIRDRDEPTSTNFDIYAAPMNGDGEVLNLTESNLAWDTRPVVSPDGRKLAYLAMARPGLRFPIRRTPAAWPGP